MRGDKRGVNDFDIANLLAHEFQLVHSTDDGNLPQFDTDVKIPMLRILQFQDEYIFDLSLENIPLYYTRLRALLILSRGCER